MFLGYTFWRHVFCISMCRLYRYIYTESGFTLFVVLDFKGYFQDINFQCLFTHTHTCIYIYICTYLDGLQTIIYLDLFLFFGWLYHTKHFSFFATGCLNCIDPHEDCLTCRLGGQDNFRGTLHNQLNSTICNMSLLTNSMTFLLVDLPTISLQTNPYLDWIR